MCSAAPASSLRSALPDTLRPQISHSPTEPPRSNSTGRSSTQRLTRYTRPSCCSSCSTAQAALRKGGSWVRKSRCSRRTSRHTSDNHLLETTGEVVRGHHVHERIGVESFRPQHPSGFPDPGLEKFPNSQVTADPRFRSHVQAEAHATQPRRPRDKTSPTPTMIRITGQTLPQSSYNKKTMVIARNSRPNITERAAAGPKLLLPET